MGYAQDAFCRVRKAYNQVGIEALKEKSHWMPNIRNRVTERVEHSVVKRALKDCSLVQKHANGTLRQRQVFIPPAGVRRIRLAIQPGDL